MRGPAYILLGCEGVSAAVVRRGARVAAELCRARGCALRVLVTGAEGMLGSDLCPVLSEAHDVYPVDIREMDVREASQVLRTVRQVRPDVVIHAAALTDVDLCQRQPKEAFEINSIGTWNVATACLRTGAAMMYISTVAVFDGTKVAPYTEYDTPNPQSVYGQSKYQGEIYVRSLLSTHYIVRAGWLFGGGPQDKKFVAKLLALARERSTLQMVDDKFGSPTYTKDMSHGMEALIEAGCYGTYHMVNTGEVCSRYQYAQRVLQFAGNTTCCLVPTSSPVPEVAPRPRMEAALNRHMEQEGRNLMRPWPDALKEYIQSLASASP